MDVIGRRTALRSLLCGVVAAGLGAGLVANPVEAMPLAMQKEEDRTTSNAAGLGMHCV
jgi:hypothetical protein